MIGADRIWGDEEMDEKEEVLNQFSVAIARCVYSPRKPSHQLFLLFVSPFIMSTFWGGQSEVF